MKTLFKLIIGLIMLVNVVACNDDAENDLPSKVPNLPVKIQFTEDLIIPSSVGSDTIMISFSKPATTNGTIFLESTTDAPVPFSTNPPIVDNTIEIPVKKGDASAHIILTLGSSELEEDFTIQFEITQVDEGFELSSKKTMTLTVEKAKSEITVDFLNHSAVILENDPHGVTLEGNFSSPIPSAAIVTISVEGDLSAFTSTPSFSSEKLLEVSVGPGQSTFAVTIIPNDDDQTTRQRDLTFSIISTTGGIALGTHLTFELTIKEDDQSSGTGRPKSYISYGGGWTSQKTFEYDEKGRVFKVYIAKSTPASTNSTDTYYYNEEGQLERINHFPDHDEYFLYEEDHITKSEYWKNGQLEGYTDYSYDAAGNVGGSAKYYLQANGEYKLGLIFLYLYFTDGNLYKQQTYVPSQNDENDYTLISTRTYEGYREEANPFPIEIIPTVPAQNKLPMSYRLEEEGMDLNYNFSYDFNEEGLPTKRVASGAASEVTEYTYY